MAKQDPTDKIHKMIVLLDNDGIEVFDQPFTTTDEAWKAADSHRDGEGWTLEGDEQLSDFYSVAELDFVKDPETGEYSKSRIAIPLKVTKIWRESDTDDAGQPLTWIQAELNGYRGQYERFVRDPGSRWEPESPQNAHLEQMAFDLNRDSADALIEEARPLLNAAEGRLEASEIRAALPAAETVEQGAPAAPAALTPARRKPRSL